MTQKLREVGLMNRPVPGLNISQSSSASSIDYCIHYRFDHPKRPSVATVQPTRTSSASSSEESRIKSEVEWLAQMGRENYRKNQMNGASSPTPSPPPSNGRSTTTGNRGKRQTASPNASSILGTRFNISCTAKGEVVEDSGDRLMSLCTTCWAWRRLPDNYFPQFINELICDARDNVCLSGWASCSQSYRTLSVLRQHTNGTWEPVSIQAGACCECKVLAGSALNSLVVGLGMSGSLAANRSP
uniref:Uncharacterized protein n=1 Tax=Plectus sambesii TaxID=2011161 RepID=A0A914V4D7_9BILA